MNKRSGDQAFEEYVYWAKFDKQMFRKINALIKSIERDGTSKGLGKPEKLKHQPGWSRRIDETNRLIYSVDDDGVLSILSCRGHYED